MEFDPLDGIQDLIGLVGPQGIQGELRVPFRGYRDPFAVLEVDDVQDPAADQDAVRGPPGRILFRETRDIHIKIDMLLHHRAGRVFKSQRQGLYIIQICIRVALHLVLPQRVPFQRVHRPGKLCFSEICGLEEIPQF